MKLPGWVPRGSVKDVCIGNYNYGYLFKPKWPFCRRKEADSVPPFFAVNEPLPLLLAILMGFQHAAAMVPGIVLGPLIIAAVNPNKDVTQYLIEVCLMASGIGTILHVVRIRIPFTRLFYGTGLISVVGVTTTQAAVGTQSIARDVDNGLSWNDAYGRYLGTVMVTSFITTFCSFLPKSILRRLFPTYIAGLTVFLVGVFLCGIEISNWGGGAQCTSGPNQDLCSGNGKVLLPFGSSQYLGIGAVAFLSLLLFELFGSPMIRNCEVILAFLISYAVAAFVRHDGNRFVDGPSIRNSPNGTFFWVKTFKLGIYPGSILPFVIGYLADAATAIGDLAATEEVSAVETEGRKHDERVQGCLLADGMNSLFAALATAMPLNVFAQNNGIIAFSNCASRMAGVACGCWLFLCGVIGKIGAFFTYAPNCVVGGISTFLFGSIAVSGVLVMTSHAVDRRTRFILAFAGSIGLGISLKPTVFTENLWPQSENAPVGARMVKESVTIILGTGYVCAWLVAMILDNLIPHEVDPSDRIRQKALHRDIEAADPSTTKQLAMTPPDAKIMENPQDAGMHDVHYSNGRGAAV